MAGVDKVWEEEVEAEEVQAGSFVCLLHFFSEGLLIADSNLNDLLILYVYAKKA